MALSNDFIDSLEPLYKALAEKDEVRDEIKAAAIHRFNENLIRLRWRYEALSQVEAELYSISPDSPRDSRTVQFDFVDKTEAYYQQLYATLSAFVMVINKLASHEVRRGLNVSRNERFLSDLLRKYPEISDDISNVEIARAFRAKFVDHIQQHTLHDWCTVSNLVGPGAGGCTLIYFLRANPAVHGMVFRPGLDPYAAGYEPPVDHAGFYVSPLYQSVQKSFENIVRHVLGKLPS